MKSLCPSRKVISANVHATQTTRLFYVTTLHFSLSVTRPFRQSAFHFLDTAHTIIRLAEVPYITISTPDLHSQPADNGHPISLGSSLLLVFTMIRFPTFQEAPTCQNRPSAKDSLRDILRKFPPTQIRESKEGSFPSSTTTSTRSSARSSTSSIASKPKREPA